MSYSVVELQFSNGGRVVLSVPDEDNVTTVSYDGKIFEYRGYAVQRGVYVFGENAAAPILDNCEVIHREVPPCA